MLRWGVTLGIAFFGGAALIGYPDLIGQAPVFSTMALAIILSLSMAAWMRFRHRMAALAGDGATMGLGIGLVALHLIPASDLFEWVTRGVPGHARSHAVPPRPLYGEHGPPRARRLSPDCES